MTTLLLHVCHYSRCKANGPYRRHQQLLQRRSGSGGQRVPSAAAGLKQQPNLSVFANYFASSKILNGRYTPALTADLHLTSPSGVAMSAGGLDTQAAPCCLSPGCLQQQQQLQQGSFTRSYSDTDLPKNARKQTTSAKRSAAAYAKTATPTSVEAPAAAASPTASSADCGGIATFSISDPGSAVSENPVTFRHSFDCLLNINAETNSVVASPWPTSPPLPIPLPLPTPPPPHQAPLQRPLTSPLPQKLTPKTPTSPTPLRKVMSCGSALSSRPKKQVHFADEVGKQLRQVRIFSEPSCAPPRVLTFKSSFPADNSGDDTAGHSGNGDEKGGLLKCQFAQPSSKYILFRENVENNCVSLSNLYFENLTVKGSVAVKNISFDKRVFLRVTFNEWVTSQNVEASYASSQDSRQDMFVFSFDCPSNCERGFEFCVCYETGGQAFWDSNGGANYKVSVRRPKSSSKTAGREAYTSDYKPNFSQVTDFSEFSVWDHFADRVYY